MKIKIERKEMANKKQTNNLSNRQVSFIFNIPYATVKDKEKDWRPNLLEFLASLNEKEIEIVKNRARTIND